jgi:two-component system sensor histidine kinase YesM
MKRKFFIKKLILFLPILALPLILLGSFSVLMSRYYINQEISRNNTMLLRQIKDGVDLIFNTLDNFILDYEVDIEVVQILKSVFNSRKLSYYDYKNLKIIQNYLFSSVNSKPYIHSVSIYYRNDMNMYFSSVTGLSYFNPDGKERWFELFTSGDGSRSVRIEKNSLEYLGTRRDPVISLYKNLYPGGANRAEGIIALNINIAYLENIIKKISVIPEQNIWVIHSGGDVIVQKNDLYMNDYNGIIQFVSSPGFRNGLGTYRSDHGNYSIMRIGSDKFGWTYLSVMLESKLYKISTWIQTATLLMLLAALIIGFALALYLTVIEYNRFNNVFTILSNAESGLPILPLPDKVKDEYGLITQRVLKTFIEQNYIKLQLSQKMFEQKAMELQALQAQINPHFLFNTLETINWKVVVLNGLDSDASRMLQNLSGILKYSLNNSEAKITVRDEIEYTKRYVNILQMRYAGKFDVIWDYLSDIEDIRVIKLFLQPLVENSIYHGVKEKTGKCKLKIKFRIKADMLYVTVIDNGRGISRDNLRGIRECLRETKSANHHIGLANTNRRLSLAYGEEYFLKIRSKYDWGTAVYLGIPRF